jgi:putative ABC transport system ATP-binding protein
MSRAGRGSALALASSAVLRLEKVNKYYRVGTHSLHVLRDIEVEVADGEFVAIMGASGSGKSTLLNILGILDDYDSGDYWLGDTLIRNLTERKAANYRNRFIGFVFQSFNLLPTLSAQENILLPLAIAGCRPPAAEVDALIERVGLTERRGHRPAELSGGQQQRVAIARALITRPTVLFADEPTGNLDSEAGAAILQLLRDAVDLDGQTTLMVTHDPRAAATADRVLYLTDGRVVADIADPTEADVLAVMKEAAR